MTRFVVATAGHVDHGKSSLILRLTGMDPDRFEEEKRRGLTIDLGFAWCTLPSGREIGFVDVPGHERFVRNMLAGVGPVKLVLFVVAADEGWKPQSEEHLAIVDVLGAAGGVVALTKSDLVDAPTLERRTEEIAERLAGTALGGSRVVSCSSETGEGIEELRAALDEMVAEAPEPETGTRARLFVDRVFSIKGAGTVVTGTLTGGALRTGDEVELSGGRRARIRGLQTHKRTIQEAAPVSRVAVNLAGIDRGELQRGDVLAHTGEWRSTREIEARVRPVRSLAHPLTSRGAFKLYAGSAERDARIRFYGTQAMDQAGAFARIRLSAPVVLDVFDRFVLREAGRQETVAGGVVLDVAPPIRPGADAVERLSARENAARAQLAELLVAERSAVGKADVLALTGLRATDVPGAISASGWLVTEALFDRVAGAIEQALDQFHDKYPMREGADLALARTAAQSELERARVSADTDLIDALLDRLVSEGELVREGSTLRLATFHPALAGEEVTALVKAVADSPSEPPTIKQLLASGHARETIDAAVGSWRLVKISPEVVMTTEFVQQAEELLHKEAGEGITVSAFREKLGTSRKYAVPLLEYFDRKGVTRREGDLRIARR